MVGKTISHYRILEKLGSGGMGVVYKAGDLNLGRMVALKFLSDNVAADLHAHQRFQREAHAASTLNHPNICTIYEIGQQDGQPFLVMEYIEGRSLKDELVRGPLSMERLGNLGSQICAAIEHAHKRGVLHRDIKSTNILLTQDGDAKVCDFGLAKFLKGPEETQSQLTGAGTWVGTLHYSPPEVINAQKADQRSDLYSLGVMMYEMACGHLPFEGLDGTALVAAILYGNATPLRQRNPTLPPALEGAIEKAMAGRPGDRFASVAEFAVALREALTPSSNTPSATAATATGQPVLAVLEFENVSGDPASDWLGTGLAETLNADLRKLKLVRVVSRERAQEALRRRGTARQVANLADIGRELGARWLITGSFQRSGQRLRITPRVIDTATAEVLASRKIDGDWENIFELQDRVVSDVMDALEVKVELSARERIAAPETRLLEAFELYARGRKVLNELGKNSLEEARECFEKAIALDSHYQVAFSGLGATYAMRYSHRTDPDDLTRATSYLERALELDPELAEPYPYLCYAYMRQGKVEQAIAAGHKGIEYQPDFGQAHYFLGTAYIVGGELDPQYLFSAVKTLLRAGAVERRWVPTWMCLGGLALNYGAYDHAERFLKQFLDIERSGTAMGRFVGAETLLGTISLRRGDRRRAREWFELSRDRLVASDHMYRESLLALNACGLGDLVLREGDITAAQAEYRRAINTAKEFPRTLGHLRVLTRATCGLASAYAAAGERSRAEVLVRTAAEHLESIHTQPQTWVLEGGESVLHYGRGVALARLGELQPALEELSTAVARGWHDAAWTETDPEMAPLADLPRFRELVESLRGTLQPLFEP